MQILNKYKKKSENGFKEFVLNLELHTAKTTKEVITNGMLEDPVYILAALENRVGFDHFMNLNKESIYKIFQTLKNPGIILLRALKNHPEENTFITNSLPSLILKQYLDDRETTSVTTANQEDARIKIMQVVYNFKSEGLLDPFVWKLPSISVMEGSSHRVDKLGNYNQYYENGKIAVSGMIEKAKRSGTWKYFYPTGELYAVGDYVQDQKQEEWCTYHLSGNLKSSGNYVDDVKKGEWKEFDIFNNCIVINY